MWGTHPRKFRPVPDEHYRDADLTIGLSGDAWADIFLGRRTLADLVGAGDAEIRKGTLGEATALFDLFDRCEPEKAVLVARTSTIRVEAAPSAGHASERPSQGESP